RGYADHSRCAPGRKEISVIERGKGGERTAVLDLDASAGKLQEAIFPQTPQHAVRMWNAESHQICKLHLRDRQAEGVSGSHPSRGEAHGEFQEKVRDTLACVSPPDIDQMLAQASRLASRGTDQREGKLGQRRHGCVEISGGNECDCRTGEGGHGIQRRAEEAACAAESVSGKRDVEDLSPAVRQPTITECESLRQDEYAIVATPLYHQ